MAGFTVYPNGYIQGLDDAIRAQVIQLFNVLMSDDLTDEAVKRFTAGLDKTLKIERIMKQTMHVRNIDIVVKSVSMPLQIAEDRFDD